MFVEDPPLGFRQPRSKLEENDTARRAHTRPHHVQVLKWERKRQICASLSINLLIQVVSSNFSYPQMFCEEISSNPRISKINLATSENSRRKDKILDAHVADLVATLNIQVLKLSLIHI